MPPPDNWTTITEAVAESGKSERTIRRWIADGRLANRREGGRVLVNLADIDPDIEQATPATPDTSGALSDCQAKVAQLEAVLAQVEGERDRLAQALERSQAISMGLVNQQKLIEASPPARRPWWQVWGKTED
jgi:hypothetical protein